MVRLVALALFSLALLAAPAAAQTQAPCPGQQPSVTDAAGDQSADGREAPPSLDITQIFFRTEAGTTTGHIRVADLSTEAPSDPTVTWLNWRLNWTSGTTPVEISATLERDGSARFVWTENGSFGGETTGSFVPGADGLITMVVPAKFARDGAKLGKPWAGSALGTGFAQNNSSISFSSNADRAPDAEAGRDFTVAACEPPKGPPPPDVSKPVPGTPPASSSQAAALELVGVGRRTHGRRLSVRLRSTGPLSKVVVTLKRGRRTIGTGRLARIDGAATVVVKGRKTLRKGRYTLVARASGVLTTRNLTLR